MFRSEAAVLAFVFAGIAGTGCGDNAECTTVAQGDGIYTLALDGDCLGRVTASHLAGGEWQPVGTELAWQSATSGGLIVTLVDVTSQVAAADPSLFVRGADGAPLVHMSPGVVGSYYVLDGANPASMAIVTDHVRRLADGGFTFFKLDFLYAGALAGQRSQDVTGVEALRAGLASIREAAGPDAILNACGTPTLPVLGLSDSLRVGPDTAFPGFDPGFVMIASAARSYGARAHLWPLVWPDAPSPRRRTGSWWRRPVRSG